MPLFGCGRRANLSKLYFGRPPVCGIALLPLFSRCLIFWCFWIKPKAQKKNFERRKIFRSILREASRPSIRRFLRGADLPPFVTKRWRQKCPQGEKLGAGRRLAPETLRGQARARVFDGASAARSSSRFFAMRSCCALRATMIICWCLFLAVLWPARMHCFRYFRSAIPQTRGLLKYN